jgi:alkaline phosphatase D
MRRRAVVLAAPLAAALSACGSLSPSLLPAVQPTPGQALRRIAFGSCIKQWLPMPMLDTVVEAQPDLVIFGGDNVYASGVPWRLADLQAAYGQLAASPPFQRLRRLPHLAIWDDNDYGLNDGGADFAQQAESQQAFLDFWQVPADDERRQRAGIHTALAFGPPGQRVQVIALDTRSFRSPWLRQDPAARGRYRPDADPAKTMLGAAQWAWLEARLREPAELRLIVSGIQVVADGHDFERWGHLPAERQRLYDLIARTGAQGVLLLSGDRHFGALYRETRGVPYPLVDFTASGLTHSWAEVAEPGPNRLGEPFGGLNFGTIDIDWPVQHVTLALRDLAGTAQRTLSLSLADLRAH